MRFSKQSTARASIYSTHGTSQQSEIRLANDPPTHDKVKEDEQDHVSSNSSTPSNDITPGVEDRQNIDAPIIASLYLKKPVKRLLHSQYTVGWICALASEMTAAKAMLDELHMALPNAPGDDNAYQLGSMVGHNVVITCLRMGVYGTTSATAVATVMQSSYPNSRTLPLMVGIGGGVPHPKSHDIRLGDVVISTPTPEHHAVVQYDSGKVTRNGILEVRGSLNKPAPAMLNALNHLKSELTLNRGQLPEHIAGTLRQFPGLSGEYSYPGLDKDILYDLDCEHTTQESACYLCPPERVIRSERTDTLPVVHYGSIASGNRVIKHARTRDSIASRWDILCFEMEAAGLMDYFPCLVIRGICDYCDSHKNKAWQGYAALTAAAVAKELLRLTTIAWQNGIEEGRRQQLIAALKFDDSRTRRANIKQAHPHTCAWLFNHNQVIDWINPQSYRRHRGFLWIKGKPGTGKSTLVKYLLDNIHGSMFQYTNVISVSFFFNAGGSELGKSSIGMYRSLLDQFFEQAPNLHWLLDKEPFSELTLPACHWTLNLLEELFRRVVKNLGSFHLLCFIDALDECPDDQIREVVDFFQDLAHLDTGEQLHICFSSRHYPHISVKAGNQFTLESQYGHSQDILNYLDAKLHIENLNLKKRLKPKILKKSRQIFFWVVLVVRMLQKEYDRGRLRNIEATLEGMPSQVDDLFRSILTKDSIDLPRMVTSIQWVLYAFCPLSPHELYHGLLCSELLPARGPVEDEKMSDDDISRYILDTSKGIMELTMSANKKVQFIHESVREFLLRPLSLANLWPNFEGITDGPSHERLKQSCYRCMMQPSFQLRSENEALEKYAITHLLDHAEHAQHAHISQVDFINDLQQAPDVFFRTNSTFRPQYRVDANQEFLQFERICQLGFILATTSRPALSACWIEYIMSNPNSIKRLRRVLVMIARAGTRDDFHAMVAIAQNHYGVKASTSDMANIMYEMWQRLTPLTSELFSSRLHILATLLVQQGEMSPEHLNKALWTTASIGAPNAMGLCLALGADINARDANGNTAMHHAIRKIDYSARPADIIRLRRQTNACVRRLRYEGADCQIKNNQDQTPLQLAKASAHRDVVSMLERLEA